MNKKQKICLWIGIAVIVLMGLFPPFQHSMGDSTWIRYGLILLENDVIALGNLVAQWVVVLVITVGLIVTFKDKKPKDQQKE